MSAEPLILYIPGLKPKPEATSHKKQLLRCLQEGVHRLDLAKADTLTISEDVFDITAWTYDFYGKHRDIGLDQDDIDALLVRREASDDDKAIATSWQRRLLRWSFRTADFLPFTIPGLVTESCVKLGDPFWSYSPKGTSKPVQWIIDRLIINAGNNSNLLLNVGPSPKGEIPQMYVPKLLEAGKWLRKHEEAIYGTQGGPFFGQEWGLSTFKGNKVFLFPEKMEDDELVLPFMNQNILSAHTLIDNIEISFSQNRRGIRLELPKSVQEMMNPVLVLEFSSSLEATSDWSDL